VATVLANGIDVYYEEHGEGDPLLLIMGWGGNAATWRPQLRGLAERFRVIVFDNRGVGRTSAPFERYSIPQMAEDAVALLQALEVRRAHVFGVSMGGMVAQELALRFPEWVDALVLGCTSPGSERAPGLAKLRGDVAEFHKTAAAGGVDLGWFGEFMRLLWTERAISRADTSLQDFILSLIRFPPTVHGMKHQAEAVLAHDTYSRLGEIKQATFVITGDDDPLIDPENSQVLAQRIPRAQLRVFEGLRHAFHLERPDEANAAVIDFIEDARRSPKGANDRAGKPTAKPAASRKRSHSGGSNGQAPRRPRKKH